MSDTRLEERLRGALHAEADGLPMTITTAELERRLTARRRDRNGRRLTLMAAGIAAVAVGAIVAMTNGWLSLPPTGTPPSPAPIMSPAPDASPLASPSGQPGPSASAGEQLPCTTLDQATTLRPPTVMAGSTPGDSMGYAGNLVGGHVGIATFGDPTSWEIGDASTQGSIPMDTASQLVLLGADEEHCIVGATVDYRAYPSGQEVQSLGTIDQDPSRTLELPAPPVGTWIVRADVHWETTSATASSVATFLVQVGHPAGADRQVPDLGDLHDAVLLQVSTETPARLIVSVSTGAGSLTAKNQLEIPVGVTLDLTRAIVGPTGYLAVASEAIDDNPAPLYIYDLAEPDGSPERADGGGQRFSWSSDGRLASDVGDQVVIFDPATGANAGTIEVPAGISLDQDRSHGPIWTAEGSAFLAVDNTTDGNDRGLLALDGTFQPGTPPAQFAPTGLERSSDIAGRRLTMGCDDVQGPAPSGPTCAVTASAALSQDQVVHYAGNDVLDYGWAVDGTDVWFLRDADGPSKQGPLVLDRGNNGALGEIARPIVPGGSIAQTVMVGYAADDLRIAIQAGDGSNVIVDTKTGQSWPVTGTFAGWANQQGADFPTS